MSETPQTSPSSLPSENVPRGTILALLIIPAGIIVWTIIWSIGFIASIVALGVALGALALYRLGSGGRISRTGAIRVTIITIVTLVLSFIVGIVSDNLAYYLKAINAGRFFDALSADIGRAPGDYAIQFVLAIGLGALGCFSVLRTAFVQTAAANAQTAQSVQPGAAPTLYPNAPAVPAPGTDAAPPSPSTEASPGSDPEKRD
jgi:hypothetical protein